MTGVTPTNVFIRPINDPTGEVLDMSIQRVSKCSKELSLATPWMGHGSRWRRQQIKRFFTKSVEGSNSVTMNSENITTTPVKRTQHGRQIQRPIQFQHQDCLMVSPANRGEVVRHVQEELTRSRERATGQPRAGV